MIGFICTIPFMSFMERPVSHNPIECNFLLHSLFFQRPSNTPVVKFQYLYTFVITYLVTVLRVVCFLRYKEHTVGPAFFCLSLDINFVLKSGPSEWSKLHKKETQAKPIWPQY